MAADVKYRVLLVGVFNELSAYKYSFSLAISCLKTYADKVLGNSVNIRNLNILDTDEEKLIKAIREHKPSIIGFSCYLWNVGIICDFCHKVKNLFPEIKILLGGPEATGRREQLLKSCNADYLIVGEGEAVFVEILKHLSDNSPLRGIDGLILPDYSHAEASNVKAVLLPLENLPSPFSESGIPEGMRSEMFFPFETMRGCPNHCSYCLWTAFGSKSVRFYPLERIASDLEWIARKAPKSGVFVADSDTFMNKERALKMAWMFRKAADEGNLRFVFQTNLRHWDESLMEAYNHESFEINFGINALTLKTQKVFGRNCSESQISAQLAAIRKKAPKVKVFLHIMYACPGESFVDFCNSLDWALSQPNTITLFFHTQLLYGTPMQKKAKELKIVCRNSPPYYVISSAECSAAEVKIEELMLICINTWLYDVNTKDRFRQIVMEEYGGSFSRAFMGLWKKMPPISKKTLLSVYSELQDGPVFFIDNYVIDIVQEFPQKNDTQKYRCVEKIRNIFNF